MQSKQITKIFLVILIFFCTPRFVRSQQFYDTTFVVSQAVLHFESGRSEISSGDSVLLLDLFHFASKFDSTLLIIRAHTDSDGSQDFNLNLSRERAEVVAQLAQEYGNEFMSCQMEFYGERQPFDQNNSDAGKALNRRVEVLLLAKKRMTWLYGQLLDDTTKLPVLAQLFLYAKNFGDSTWSDSLGHYRLNAPIAEEVVVEIRSETYMPQFISVEIKPVVTAKPFEIEVSTARVGKNFTLLNLNFFGDQSRPLPGSRRSLDVIAKFLKRNKDVCVEVQGHINDPTPGDVLKESQSFFLSVARAKVVYDYLRMYHHIPSDRMYYRGYGDWRMLYPNARSERLQRLNRRVEVYICNCDDSKNLPNSKGSNKFVFYELKGNENLFN